MPAFSRRSRARLATCHPDLRRVLEAAILDTDFAVLCGHRTQEEQESAYAAGHSRARWGQSKHNSQPSRAVDIAPYPIAWDDPGRFRSLAEVILHHAHVQGVSLRWGGTFRSLVDMPHFELR